MENGVFHTDGSCTTVTVTSNFFATYESMKDKLDTQATRIAELKKHILSLESDLLKRDA